MRKILITLFILLGQYTHAHNHKDNEALAFTAHERQYTFSTVFELFSHSDYFGQIVKSIFHVRTHYDLYDTIGYYEGQGICCLNPTSLFGPWAKEIAIYDSNGDYIGFIEGNLLTEAGAKYSIYNSNDDRVAIAYLDLSSAGFTVVHPNNEHYVITHLKRDFEEGEIDHWHVKVYDREKIDLRILKIFAAFAVDHQAYFKEDK